MIEATIFIGAIIAGVTQTVKAVFGEQVSGVSTIIVAVLTGALVAIFDTDIGVTEITLAQGIMAGFGTVGVVSVVDRIK